MLARLLGAALSLSGAQNFRVFDTDFPNGELAGYFPASSQIIDFSKTAGHVALFDTIINEPDFDYLIDLDAQYLRPFFSIFSDIGFDKGASEAGLEITVYFIIDRTLDSVRSAQEIRALCGNVQFVPVINEAVGNVLVLPQAAVVYADIAKSREIILPRLSVEALNLTDRPDFSFADFMARNGEGTPLELRIELFGFLESVYNQKRVSDEGGAVLL